MVRLEASTLARHTMVDADESKLLSMTRNKGLSLITQMATWPSDCLPSFPLSTFFFIILFFLFLFYPFSLSPVFVWTDQIQDLFSLGKSSAYHRGAYETLPFISLSSSPPHVLSMLKILTFKCFIIRYIKRIHPLS